MIENQNVLVLTDCHALPNDIDPDETKRELGELEATLRNSHGEISISQQDLLNKVAWAQARLDVYGETNKH